MIYLRTIPGKQLFAAQLELLMQHGRIASTSINAVGALVVMSILWPYYEMRTLLLWGGGFLLLEKLTNKAVADAIVVPLAAMAWRCCQGIPLGSGPENKERSPLAAQGDSGECPKSWA